MFKKLRFKIANWLLGDELRKRIAYAVKTGEKRLRLPNPNEDKYRATIYSMIADLKEIQRYAD